MAQRPEELLELLHVGVRSAATIPQDSRHARGALPSSRSRSCFIPRCRFTRTDAGVSPVRVGDFWAGHAFDQAQHQRFPVRFGQAADDGEDRKRLCADRSTRRRGPAACRRCAAPAQVVGREVPRDRREPATERARLAEARQPLHGVDEDVLHQIVHVGPRHAGRGRCRAPDVRRARRGRRRRRDRRRVPRRSAAIRPARCLVSHGITRERDSAVEHRHSQRALLETDACRTSLVNRTGRGGKLLTGVLRVIQVLRVIRSGFTVSGYTVRF